MTEFCLACPAGLACTLRKAAYHFAGGSGKLIVTTSFFMNMSSRFRNPMPANTVVPEESVLVILEGDAFNECPRGREYSAAWKGFSDYKKEEAEIEDE